MRFSTVAAGILLVGAGQAAATPSERASVDVGATPIDVAVSDDDRLVGVAGGDGTLRIVDTADFDGTVSSTSACSEATSVAFARADDTPTFYVACSDGTVVGIEVDEDTYPATVGETTTVELGTGSIAGLAATTTGYLFAVEDSDGESLIHVIDVETGGVDELSGFPVTSIHTTESVTATPAGTYVVMGNDQGRVTKLYSSGGSYYVSTYDLLGLGTFSDVAAVDEGYAYLLDSGGMIVQYYLSGDNSYMTLATDLGAVIALDIAQDGDGGFQFYVADDDGLLSIIPSTGGDPDAEIQLSEAAAGDLATSSSDDARAYIGAGDSSLIVVGEAPWVEITALSPAEVYEGESFTLSFTVDTDCSYDIVLGGGIDGSGQTMSGYSGVAEAGSTVDLEIDSADLEEGDNRIFVFATASGYTGRDSDTVFLDTPPDAVQDFAITFGDEKLYLSWTSNDETDIDRYVLCFADSSFDEGTGAPEFQVVGPGTVIESPVSVDHEGEDIPTSYTLQYLTNGVEYCAAVYAEDEGGQEGPWSETLCDEPEQTLGAGDDLGYCGSCDLGSTAGRAGVSVGGCLAAWFVWRRRRTGD